VKYVTPVKFENSSGRINYSSRLVFLGSCFSENIGYWLKDLRFNTVVNPYGITYNPISIAQQINKSIAGKAFSQEHMLDRNGEKVHLDLHKNLETNATNLTEISKSLKSELIHASHLILTFGSSYAFRYLKTGKIINNCHKISASEFEKVLLNESEMFAELESSLEELLSKNEALSILLTVSPIRHLRHGAVGNQRSKSRLIRLCEMLESRIENVQYIPIYELVMDELRDYRFYRSDDMLHLNYQGLETVKERVKGHYIDSSSHELMSRVERWLKMKNHRLLNPESQDSQKFQAKLKSETDELEKVFRELRSPD